MRVMFLVLTLAAMAMPAPGQDAPAPPQPEAPICRAELEGQLSCQANRVCECVFATAVPARGLPDRWRWNCSILRPRCRVVPPDTQDYQAFDGLSALDFLILNEAGRTTDRVFDGRRRNRPN
ncbi:MAG: hypothetical protein ACFB22_14525 [Rhodothalassiaceae bacterium]